MSEHTWCPAGCCETVADEVARELVEARAALAKARGDALEEAAHALVGVARDYRAKYGRNVESVVCLPLKDGIIAIRSLLDTQKGGRE